jgi:UDP-N-acetylglucosamine 4,6-dehydratase
VVYSRGEAKQAEMKAAIGDDRMRYFIGDVRDPERIAEACRGIDIVIHAAALKRVEVCESDPNEAIETNIKGTQNVARACIGQGVEKALFLSTDKAAAPNTLYGSTKLVAERCWNGANIYSAGTSTRFAVTRYGNVAGSTGSVIPTWRSQASSGPISITHLGMSRFLMSMQDAIDLVILALTDLRGGSIYVPKLKGVGILQLKDAVAPDATFKVTGIRPGEKLHECLITESEARTTWDCGTHFLIEPEARTWGKVAPPKGELVGRDFQYQSNTAPRFADAELAEMAA